ncbi:hypothetical protein V502_04430 [Pseudogymnoascus sp. VKM F-4520 (FW-2644)]|nr:hypothetical protein V502_04430 [Pseudogymnoascus sp. VKM F-4520 (FW-2644)]
MKVASFTLFGAVSQLVIGLAVATAENYFEFETVQLLDSDLDSPTDTIPTLFSFDKTTDTDDQSDIVAHVSKGCKVFPGDSLWPLQPTWELFNELVSGALIKTVPIAAPCHNGPYYVRMPDLKIDQLLIIPYRMLELDPTSIMSPLYQGLTCTGTTDPTTPCTFGGFPVYAVNVTTVAQIQLAVNFARNANMRLVIKNTGHDFSGKSSGAGALSIWTHHLNSIAYTNHYVDKSLQYSGPAFKMGSGVIARDAYAAAQAKGLMIVGGEGATVGVMGGYITGGGHSPMSSLYGMAADQVLAMEVVTANGRFVTADSTQNSDLFWALCGGGGSTFGIVTSVTVRAYHTMAVTVSLFNFTSGGNITVDTFWAGVRALFDNFIIYTEASVYSYFWIIPIPGGNFSFLMKPFWAPGSTAAQTQALLKPFLDQLEVLGIPVAPTFTEYTTFDDAWSAAFPVEIVGRDSSILASRLFQKSAWLNETILNSTFDAWKAAAVEDGDLLLNFNLAAPNVNGVDNCILPAWRGAILHSIAEASWVDPASNATILAVRDGLSNRMLQWKAITPDSGAYAGEGDRDEVDFQQNFFGANYPRLLGIKQSVDPKNVFWARNAVGSESLSVVQHDIVNDENGRLCFI